MINKQVEGDPLSICRQNIFGIKAPTNDARLRLCNDEHLKKAWVDCLVKTMKQVKTKLKPEYQDKSQLHALPKKKMVKKKIYIYLLISCLINFYLQDCYKKVLNSINCKKHF